MSFVYKYVAGADVVYVGKVNGDSLDDLAARLAAHRTDFNGHASRFAIYYTRTSSPADADILETAVIAQLHPYYNKAKTKWGDTAFSQLVDTLTWTLWDDRTYVRENVHKFNRDFTTTVCEMCGECFPLKNGYRVAFDCIGEGVSIGCEGRLCSDCMSKWMPLADTIFYAMSDSFVWRRSRKPDLVCFIDLADDSDEV